MKSKMSALNWCCLLLLSYSSLLLVDVASAATKTEATTTTPACTSSDMQEGTCKNPDSYDPVMECGVFMAPSTLGETTNMGIYLGKELNKGEEVPFPEIAIPLLFRQWGTHVEGIEDGELWDRYIWEGSVCDIETYDDRFRDRSKAVFVPGVGCTINGVMDMHNIESTHGSIYDTAGLHRSRDPGSGAFTPYHSSKSKASTRLPAGAELFADYGEDWIPELEGAQITLNEVMETAEEFLKDDYAPFIREHKDELSDKVKQGLWQFTKDFPLYSQTYTVLPRDVPWEDVQKELDLVEEQKNPKSDKFQQEVLGGGTAASVVRRFLRRQSVRSLEWLREKGHCQDHLKPGRSTIPQAGRGAFASRFLPEGTVVGYAPLIHIGVRGRDVYDIGYLYNETLGYGEEDPPPSKMDLIINYSFGHANSTVLLTPYGAMVNYINHANGKSKDKKNNPKPNVKVRWPEKELIAHKPSWLKEDALFLRDTLKKIGLSFEYVALRDIQEGEEVLMDYGDVWQEAWDEHVKNWEPPEGAENYVHSSEWLEAKLRTPEELKADPYPDNLVTMCEESYHTVGTSKGDGQTPTFEWLTPMEATKKRAYCTVLERFEKPIEDKTKKLGAKKKEEKEEEVDEVVDLDGDDKEEDEGNDGDDEEEDEEEDSKPKMAYTYTVEMKVRSGRGFKDIVVTNVPEKHVYLYDKAYSADWHLPNVFRHPIMIPDDVVPASWLNK